MLATLLIDPVVWFYPDRRQRCERAWHHDEGSPPRSANVEQVIKEEHAREMPNTLTIIRDDFQMADNPVAMQAEMTKEELV